MNYTVDIQLIDNSLEELYQVKKNYDSDSGFDLYIPETIIFRPGETKLVDLKVKCKCYDEHSTYGYYMYPRSSISKTPLTMCNSVGIIDKDYRGNIMVALRYNIDKNVLNEWTKLIVSNISNGNSIFNDIYDKLPTYTLEKGTRIVQLTMPTLIPFKVNFVDKLDETNRGDGGFGSTGR
jgi:dUTP pyrophosphatase